MTDGVDHAIKRPAGRRRSSGMTKQLLESRPTGSAHAYLAPGYRDRKSGPSSMGGSARGVDRLAGINAHARLLATIRVAPAGDVTCCMELGARKSQLTARWSSRNGLSRSRGNSILSGADGVSGK